MTTTDCHHRFMVKHAESAALAELLDELKQLRVGAIEHTRAAQESAWQRLRMIDTLLAKGLSQADLARELG